MDETAYETSYGESEPKPKKPAKRKAKPALKALPNIEQVAAFLKSVYEVEGGDIKGALAVAGSPARPSSSIRAASRASCSTTAPTTSS